MNEFNKNQSRFRTTKIVLGKSECIKETDTVKIKMRCVVHKFK